MNTPGSPHRRARLFIVDDHEIVVWGMTQLINAQIDIAVCGEAPSTSLARALIASLNPDLVILDLSLKEGDGLELLKELKRDRPEVRVLVLSMHDECIWAEVALRAGAHGYLMKEVAIQKLLTAIRRVLVGQIYISDNMASKLVHQHVHRPSGALATDPVERLSDRESQILRMIGEWRSTREIAESLGLSVKTVEYHREKLKQKLNFKRGSELTRYAVDCAAKTSFRPGPTSPVGPYITFPEEHLGKTSA